MKGNDHAAIPEKFHAPLLVLRMMPDGTKLKKYNAWRINKTPTSGFGRVEIQITEAEFSTIERRIEALR